MKGEHMSTNAGEYTAQLKWSTIEDMEGEIADLKRQLRAAIARIVVLESPPKPESAIVAVTEART